MSFSLFINRLTTLNETTITAAGKATHCVRPANNIFVRMSFVTRVSSFHWLCSRLTTKLCLTISKLNPNFSGIECPKKKINFNDIVQSCCTMYYNDCTCPLNSGITYHLIHANSTNWADMICVHIRWKTFFDSSFVFGWVIRCRPK